MNSPAFAYGLALFTVLNLAVGQVLFKSVAARIWPLQSFLQDAKGMALLAAALLLYGVSTISWIFALRVLPLGKAYMFMACSFLIVPLAAYYFFGEPLTIKNALGAMLVVIGIWVVMA